MFLNNHTYYSLRYGTISPTELVEWALAQNLKSLVLTDINNVSCAYEFINRCKEADIKPIIGVEFRQKGMYYYTAIAKNTAGFQELCNFLSTNSLEQKDLLRVAPTWKHCYTIYRHLPKPPSELLDHEYVGIRPQEANRLYHSDLLTYRNKLVVFNPIAFTCNSSYSVHKILRAIDCNKLLSQLKPDDAAIQYDRPLDVSLIEQVFAQYPEVLQNTEAIIENCSISMESTPANNRRFFGESHEKDFALLTELAVNGCKNRYGHENEEALTRTMHELSIIKKMDFCTYFLITWDMINYAKRMGIHHVGRGSGANSIVAYNLSITDVDPIELNLYFERFINPQRSTPPDFDLDFAWSDRDQVTRYIFDKYGEQHTALLSTFNTFKGKSIIRELGKVFGLTKDDIDLIIKFPNDRDKQHPIADKIFYYGKKIENFPNYLSIHAGGILISEKPLAHHTALQMMPKGFPVTHFDMYTAEALQFHKFDVLSQRGLGHIKDAVEIIKKNRGKAVDIHNIPFIKNDHLVGQLLKSANCVGCFYIESPAMRGLLHKLQCNNYIELIAASSIIRPGVAKSGMMKAYIERCRQGQSFRYLHPVFEEHLSETFGIMVYQEDVMKIVHHFAGLDLDEADILRRIMTGKKKSSATFLRLQEKFFRNCAVRGHDAALTKEVWRQIASFSGYSFCKAHSASFAVESYQSMFLKAHFPFEFMVAVINNFGGFYSTELYIHEARMLGAEIEAPCLNRSMLLTDIDGETIYLGFKHVIYLESKLVDNILWERGQNGAFRSLSDFIQRVSISRDQLLLLIRVGAFRFTGMHKSEVIWEQMSIHRPSNQKSSNLMELSFAEEASTTYELKTQPQTAIEKAYDEIELLGFPLCSPFELVSTHFRGDIVAKDMLSFLGKVVTMVGYFVTKKDVTTTTQKYMNFSTWIDHQGNYFDTIHFHTSLDKYPFEGKACYSLKGKIVEDFGFASLEVYEMEKLPMLALESTNDEIVEDDVSKEYAA